MQARVTAASQTYRLRERMEKAEVNHGQEIRADLPGVRVMAMGRDWLSLRPRPVGEVFFCTMGPIRIRKEAIPGDGHALPASVILDGLEVPGAGTYDLMNVLVRSNGDLRLIVDEAARVVPTAVPEPSLAAF
ncbi:MAG TPA: hypothetical protein VF046_06275 [Gemmatimonadales bacterium]|jgi:hypothetical protein